MLEGDHWFPHTGPMACGKKRAAVPSQPPDTEGYGEDEEEERMPNNVVRDTLFIWHRPDCVACQANEGVFRRLEQQNGRPFDVVRVQATAARLRTHPWIRALPTFDVVRLSPDPSASYGLYGPGTYTLSIPNNRQQELTAFFGTDVFSER